MGFMKLINQSETLKQIDAELRASLEEYEGKGPATDRCLSIQRMAAAKPNI